MAPSNQRLSIKAIAPICAVAFICLGCLGSILYVNEANPALQENNHWQKLDLEESRYVDIKQLLAASKETAIPAAAQERCRELAMIYRQQGNQEMAGDIYRRLWVSNASTPAFAQDAPELASIYTDMGAYASAVESYQKILQYDRARLPATDSAIGRDLNNLGQCYYTAACGTSDAKLRHQYFCWAREQFEAAKKIGGHSPSPERDRADQSIIEINEKLVDVDLGHT